MKRKLNILYCVNKLWYAGTEKQLVYLIENIDRDKFSPSLCCLQPSDALYEDVSCPKLQLNFSSFLHCNTPVLVYKLSKFIEDRKIDLIQTFFQDPTLLAYLSSLISRRPKIISSLRDMGFWANKRTRFQMRLVYGRIPYFLANSNAVKRYYSDEFNIPQFKIRVIHNFILPPENITNKVRNYKNDDGNLYVGLVSNLNRDVKRVDLFINAASKIFRENKRVRFAIIGDGHLKAYLEKLVVDLGMSEYVYFRGTVENIYKALEKIDIGVLTSDSEGFPNAILEYMASGLPVVATNVGGNSEIIDENCGFLVPKGDVDALATAVNLLASNEDLRFKMGSNCRKKVMETFTWEKICPRIESYYEEIYNTDN